MKSRKKKISIVIPVFNEEDVISELVVRLKKYIKSIKNYEYEVVFVENGSQDSSYDLLKKAVKNTPNFKVVQLSKNFSADGGIVAGLNFINGDACVIMMADLQEPIELIGSFIKKRTASPIRNFSSKLFYKFINLLTNNMFPENASDFRLIDKKVYEAIKNMPEQNKYL